MSALVGALRVSLSADTAKFEDGMKRAQRTASTGGNAIAKALGANLNIGKQLERTALRFVEVLSLGAMIAAAKSALEYAGHLGELADTLGLTTRDLQTFSYAAGQVGISQEELETGIQKLTISMGQAEVGAKKQINAFNALGISVDSLKGKTAGDIFREIADKLEKVSDRSQRAAIEVALFGKAGAKLDNLLSGAQGKLGDLSDSAEKLGLVLSDEQIQNADRTADKITELQTALKTRIAGVVADNSSAIFGLIDALEALVSKLPTVIRSYQAFIAMMAKARGYLAMASRNPDDRSEGRLQVAVADSQFRDLQNQQRGGDSFDTRAARMRSRLGLGSPSSSGADLPQFLAPAGGSPKHHKAAADHSEQDKLRADNEFDQQLRRAQMDVLHAQQDLATDYVERTTIGVQILDSEKAARDAQHRYEVALYKITKGKEGESPLQAAQLQAQEDIKDGLDRQKLLQDEQTKRQEGAASIAKGDLDRRRDVLDAQAAIATTAAERRKVELELLKIAYTQKRQALQNTIDTSKDDGEVENARRDLANLNKTYSLDKQGVINQTRGPLEEWAATVPQTAAQINEALQSIEVQGLDGLSSAIAEVIDGTKSLGDAFGEVAKSIIADLIQMAIKMLVFRVLSSAIPGLFQGSSDPYGVGSINVTRPKFATGGGFTVLGNMGVDKNLLSINGLPIANVSHGERISVSNDNTGGVTINQTIAPNFAGNAATQDDLVKMAIITKNAAIDAVRQSGRRSS